MKVKWAKKGGVDTAVLNRIFGVFGEIDRAVAGKRWVFWACISVWYVCRIHKYVVRVQNIIVWNLSQILTVLVAGQKIVYCLLCVCANLLSIVLCVYVLCVHMCYVLCVHNTVFGAFGEIDHAVAGKKLVVWLECVLCMYVVCVCNTLFGAPCVKLTALVRAKICVCFLSFCVWYVCMHAWRYGFVFMYTEYMHI